MTVQTTFFDWARSGLDWNVDPWEQMSPNLLALNTWLVTNFGGQALGLDDFDREIRTGGTISDHAYGAALDWRYEPGWLPNTSPVEVSRPEALKLVEHIIDWSAELHVDRIHDYVGDRIWTAGRTPNVADAHTAWWRKQNGAGSGMGKSWARYFHFATTRDGWADSRAVALRGVPLPGAVVPPPKPPTPAPAPKTAPTTGVIDMVLLAHEQGKDTFWFSPNAGISRYPVRDMDNVRNLCAIGALDAKDRRRLTEANWTTASVLSVADLNRLLGPVG